MGKTKGGRTGQDAEICAYCSLLLCVLGLLLLPLRSLLYARPKTSTRGACARFATCVQKRPIREQEKTKPNFSFLSVSCLGLSWIVLSCLCLVLCVVLCLVSRLVLSIVRSLTMDNTLILLCQGPCLMSCLAFYFSCLAFFVC